MSIEKIGCFCRISWHECRAILVLLIAAWTCLSALKKAPVRAVLYRQIYFTGLQALGYVGLIGVISGVVVLTQVVNTIGVQAAVSGKLLLWIVVRELGPLLTAMVVITRSSSAIAAELGTMKVGRELMILQWLGIGTVEYLVMPRLLGMMISVFILTFYFQLLAVIGGLVLSSLLMDFSLARHFTEMVAALSGLDLWLSFCKSLFFGMMIALLSCYYGLKTSGSITDIPRMTTKAVTSSLLLVILINAVFTLLVMVWSS